MAEETTMVARGQRWSVAIGESRLLYDVAEVQRDGTVEFAQMRTETRPETSHAQHMVGSEYWALVGSGGAS